jgi:hypothetical protein
VPSTKPPPQPENALRLAAVIAALSIIGLVAVLDILRDGTLEPTSVGLLTGVIGPVVMALVIRGGNGGSK